MTIKYALLNPADGSYDYYDTEEQIKNELTKRAISFYISHAHGVVYSKVTTDEHGWETWDGKEAFYVENN